jgi:hypothetical protein
MNAATAFEDWLLLAGNPDDARLHFLGTFDRRITFYSQQVRALRLVHALSCSGKLKQNDNISVVGAGAAGVTAAVALALLGNDVTIYDPASSVLQLQSASPRLLHPHIYEWPGLGSLDDRAGLPVMDWSAGSGGEVCEGLEVDFDAVLARLPKLRFERAHTLSSLEKVGERWRLELAANGEVKKKQFDHVVFAMGFGNEVSCGEANPTHYWKNNSTGSAEAEPSSPASYIVSGNGDGGLTDLLNLLVKKFDHVSFTKRFLSYFSDDSLRVATKSAYASVALGDDLEAGFKTHLLPILDELGVLDRLSTQLRSDRTVTFNSSGPLFAASKAAQLNQVMVFAVLEAAKRGATPVKCSFGKILDVVKGPSGFKIDGPEIDGVPLDTEQENVILRHGPDRTTRYAPVGAYFDSYKLHVTNLLAARPDLNEPPVLNHITYEFFEQLRISRLEDAASQVASQASVATARATLAIGIDPATHAPIEQGSFSLLELVKKCEQLTSNFTLHLVATPEKTPESANIVRFARASGGRISLLAGPDVIDDWKKLVPSIGSMAASASHCPSAALNIVGLAEAIDACLLRLLDKEIESACASRTCHSLGPFNASIAEAIAPTWAQWHATLKADHALVGEFLLWLTNIDQNQRLPWSGNHTEIPHLATALVLMLAAHHGEPLTPASVERGNLEFSGNAVALGSGCQMLGQNPIAIWDQPDQWGVDALILSGSAEVEVLDTPGSILDGGKQAVGMTSATRVRPVVIQNNKYWRGYLAGDLTTWIAVVEKEFTAWRNRQDKALEEIAQ